MHKSSVLEIIRTLSKEELIRFEDFLKSPYFNKKENILKIYLEIKNYYPDFSNENLKKESVWKKLFPGNKYNYGIMKNLIFDLNKLVVKFIDLENYSLKKSDSDLNILEQFKNRGLHTLFEKKYDDTNKYLNQPGLSKNLYEHKYKTELLKILEISSRHEIKNILEYDFTDWEKHFIKYFFVNLFYENYNLYQIAFLYNKEPDRKLHESFIKFYKQSGIKDYYTEMAFYTFQTVFLPDKDENYFKLKELFYSNFNNLVNEEKFNFCIALMNYCKNNSNKGKLEFIPERYQYVKLLADENLYGSTKYINRFLFMSTVIASCTAKDFDWCENYIKKYSPFIDDDFRDQTVNYAYTHFYFKQGNFEKSLSFLSKCENSIGMDKINIRTFQFFLYYELKYHEELKLLADSSKHYLRNDKTISKESKANFGKFIDIVCRIDNYRLQKEVSHNDEYTIEEIKKYISDNEMAGKKWLNTKLAELE